MKNKAGKSSFKLHGSILGVFVILFVFYVYYQMLNGSRNVFVWNKFSEQKQLLETQNNALLQQKKNLEINLDRLSDENPDIDFIEEQIRRNLPYVYKNEKIIFLKNE